MSYEFLDLSRAADSAHIAVLRLNRPDNLNSWNQKMREELRDAVAELVDDDQLRVLVITGTGRAFSAGEDVRGMMGVADIGTRGFRRVARGIHNVFDEIEATLGRGVRREAVLATLHQQGFTMTMASFKSALQRIRRERAST